MTKTILKWTNQNIATKNGCGLCCTVSTSGPSRPPVSGPLPALLPHPQQNPMPKNQVFSTTKTILEQTNQKISTKNGCGLCCTVSTSGSSRPPVSGARNRGDSRFRLAQFCTNLPHQWSHWLLWCAWIDNTAAMLALAMWCLPSCHLLWHLLDQVLTLEVCWKVRSLDLWLMFCEIGGWEQRQEIVLGQMDTPCTVDSQTMMLLRALQVGLEMLMLATWFVSSSHLLDVTLIRF